MYRLYCYATKSNKYLGIENTRVYIGLAFGDLKNNPLIVMRVAGKEIPMDEATFCGYFNVGSYTKIPKEDEPW